ncbi:hypothetical protein BDV93DRAFT_607931 [Ceratobasidium sp. AG-I]|nr:hypothetical protein BDV93DRAFT_607931 [Ceratobasidium sp. AG-I]
MDWGKKGDSVTNTGAGPAGAKGAGTGVGVEAGTETGAGAGAGAKSGVTVEEESGSGPSQSQSDSVATAVESAREAETHMAEEELKNIQEGIESVPVVDGKVIEQEQPALWRSHGILVVDPFIRVKNVAGNVALSQVELFRMNCQRTSEALENGLSLDRIMGDFATEPPSAGPVSGPGQGSGRGRGRGGGGGGGRGRGRGRGRGD